MKGAYFADRVSQWADDRNLIEGSSPEAQFDKLMEEATELHRAIRLRDLTQIKDGIGDCEVVLRVIECQINKKTREFHEPSQETVSNDGYLFGILLKRMSLLIGRIETNHSPMFIGQAIGECRRALCLIAEHHGLTVGQCRDYAWNEIKDRKGRMVDGIFVKEPEAAAA